MRVCHCAQANIWTGESSGKPLKAYSLVSTEEMMLSLWGILTFCFFMQVPRPSDSYAIR